MAVIKTCSGHPPCAAQTTLIEPVSHPVLYAKLTILASEQTQPNRLHQKIFTMDQSLQERIEENYV
jgi:hypothetical protein